jgi:hypothetical protein
MGRRDYHWVRVRTLPPAEKLAIAGACERFIDTTLKPRFLPEIRPTWFNYPVDIFGKWRASKYSFITRYRSGHPENAGHEFDAAFTRLDFQEEAVSGIRFDVMWHRHTGQWFRLHKSVTLERALHLIQSDELLWPL